MVSPPRRRTPLDRALKAVERGAKRVALAGLTRLVARSAAAAPAWGERPHRVLYLRHDRIGDMIVSTGLLRAIANAHPSIVLDVLASPANAPVLARNPAVREVIVFDRTRPADYPALVRRLRRARYDVVVDSMVFSPSFTTLLLMLASGAPHRVGVARQGKPNVYTLLADPAPHDAHHVEHAAQLARPFGVDLRATRFDPEIVLGADERAAAESTWGAGTPRLLVNVSAGLAFRRWPDERFAAVIAHLRARLPGARVLVIGSPEESARADAIAAAGGAARVATASVRDAFALVATSDFLFTPDTSIGHAASAFRTPAVVLFVRGISARWGLYGTRGRSIESEGETLASLALEPVLAAVDAVLEEIALVPAPATDEGSQTIAPR